MGENPDRAVEYRLPVIFVLFETHVHAMSVTREQPFYDDLISYNRSGPRRWERAWRRCSR